MKNRIKQIRKDAGLTQEQFAQKIGVSRNTIATYETSDRTPIAAVILSICREFNINELWLRTGEGDIYANSNPNLQLSKWFGEILRENDSSFRKQLILTLAGLSDTEWTLLANIAASLFMKH